VALDDLAVLLALRALAVKLATVEHAVIHDPRRALAVVPQLTFLLVRVGLFARIVPLRFQLTFQGLVVDEALHVHLAPDEHL
jgi:hypothetical protein